MKSLPELLELLEVLHSGRVKFEAMDLLDELAIPITTDTRTAPPARSQPYGPIKLSAN